jgi:hypothetical protein
MNQTFKNVCIRCGKERVILREWEEHVGNFILTNTETVCPDPECQKLVDKDNKKQRDKYILMKKRSEQRAKDRNRLRNSAKIKH